MEYLRICVMTMLAVVTATSSETESLSRVRRVIGGEQVEQGTWPWLVSLRGKIPTRTFLGIPITHRTFYCGASLLNDRWVLTAAHCFKENDIGSRALRPRYWHARLGEVELTAGLVDRFRNILGEVFNRDSLRDWSLHAEQIIIHPDYDRDRLWENDIALVKLEEDVPSSREVIPEIQSVILAGQGVTSFPRDGQRCIMKGWGCTVGGGSVSSTARQVSLPKVSDASCGSFWGVSTTGRLCAGYNLQQRGICPGDSGGPLVCRGANNAWVQVGIASFTSSDRPGNVPGVFTRVSAYIDWINRVIADD